MSRSVGAGGDIRQSVIITGDGNSASLRFGAEFVLPLDRRQIAAPRRRQAGRGYDPLPLLVPDANALPLVGRAPILAELREWLNEEADISVRTLIARAGTGKTRLAIELCKAIDGARKPGEGGWNAGFIRPSDLAGVVDGLATQTFDWERPSLLVIDYAAAVHRELARWLDRLAGEAFTGKLRLLLLEREAPNGFGWWHDLARPSDNRAATRRDLFVDPDRPQHLPDLDPGEERRLLVAAVLAATTKMMGDQAPGHVLPSRGADPAFDAALATPRFGNPLNLAMAGLIAAERGPVAAIALRRLDAARHLARHELGRMVRIAQGEQIDQEAMRHSIGFNGLAGGLALATLRHDLASELAVAGLPASTAALGDVLMQQLPSLGGLAGEASEPRLGTIQPDLVGEGVIVEALLVGAPDRALNAAGIVDRAYSLAGARAAEALMRLIQDYGHAVEDPHANPDEREVARLILGLLSALAEAIPDEEIEELETLVYAFPQQTTVLREAAATQTRRLADISRRIAEAIGRNDEDLSIIAAARAAIWANNLGNRLSALGQREAALAAAEEAVDLRRWLAEVRPGDYVEDLAGSLNNLANRLGELGRREEALEVAREGVDLYRDLAAADRDAFSPALAGALINLASYLSDVGQRANALDVAKAAADLYRQLAAANPDRFNPALALSLSNLANRLSNLGRNEEALTVAQEAIDLRRALAAAHPDAFTPDLAVSLNNLASLLGAVGQLEAGLAAAQEAVDIRRALAAARPEAFTANLAGSLNNLSNRLSALGHHGRALAAAQEAVELLRPLASERPDAFAPDLAMLLTVLGDRLELVGHLSEAVRSSHESVRTLSPHFLAGPHIFAPKMINFLQEYLRRAVAAGNEVDEALVDPIYALLEKTLKELAE